MKQICPPSRTVYHSTSPTPKTQISKARHSTTTTSIENQNLRMTLTPWTTSLINLSTGTIQSKPSPTSTLRTRPQSLRTALATSIPRATIKGHMHTSRPIPIPRKWNSLLHFPILKSCLNPLNQGL